MGVSPAVGIPYTFQISSHCPLNQKILTERVPQNSSPELTVPSLPPSLPLLAPFWVFPKIMVSPDHPFVHRVFHYKQSILGENHPIFGNIHIP